MSVLGIIPARGKSKGLPRKNLYPLNGKPLIQYTIDAAQKSELIDRFIVSTEDVEISKVSKDLGAECWKRPPELAGDGVTAIQLLQHLSQQFADFPTVVFLQPTSPIRSGALIDMCLRIFDSEGCDTLATGFTSYQFEWATMASKPRQAMSGYFYDDGNVYVFKAEHLRRGEWWGENRYPLEVGAQYNLEIDTIVDLWMAEGILCHT